MGKPGISLFIALTIAAMIVFAVPVSADLLYLGETPTSGIDSYSPLFSGDQSDDSLWDYAYELDGWMGLPGDPTTFAIYTSYEPFDAWVSDSAWSWTWDDQITGFEPDYGTPLQNTWFADNNERGMVFYLTAEPTVSDPVFHFTSFSSPYRTHFALANGSSTEGIEWSAAPEPTTLLLTSLGIAAIGIARRRRCA